MSNRSAIFVSALFATVLAGANLATVTEINAQAAPDTCLTAPKDKTPAGGHWRYRLERGTGRQCWYLKEENEKTARAAPQEPLNLSAEAAPSAAAPAAAATADPAPPQPRPAVRKSIANAHAELTPPRVRAEQESNAAIEPQTTGTATIARIPKNPAANPSDIAVPSTAAPTRWIDSSDANSSSSLHVAAAEQPVASPENDQAVLQPASPPSAVPAALDPSMARQAASMQMLFLVMAGALAIAGITASLLYRFGRRARARRLARRRDRRAIWDKVQAERAPPVEHSFRAERSSPAEHSAPAVRPPRAKRSHPAGRSAPPVRPAEDVPLWRRDAPRDPPRASEEPERRVTEMLSRLARSAQH
jgi:hypothetical protein